MSQASTHERLDAEFARAVEENQRQLRSALRRSYDFIVCGSGSSGAVVARRLAENLDVSVLLIEAGGSDSVPEVEMAAAWPLNLGGTRDWGFTALPNQSGLTWNSSPPPARVPDLALTLRVYAHN